VPKTDGPHNGELHWLWSAYLLVCAALWLASVTLVILHQTGMIDGYRLLGMTPEQNDFWAIIGRLWQWTDDVVLQALIKIVLFVVLICLAPGLCITGLWIVSLGLAVALILVSQAPIALYGFGMCMLWLLSPTGKVLAVILAIASGFVLWSRWSWVIVHGDVLAEMLSYSVSKINHFFFWGWLDLLSVNEKEQNVMRDVKKQGERLDLVVWEPQSRRSGIADVPLSVERYPWVERVKERFHVHEQTKTVVAKTQMLTCVKDFYTEQRAAVVAQHEFQGTKDAFGEQDEEAILRGLEREKRKVALTKEIAKLKKKEKPPAVQSFLPVVSSIERIARMKANRADAHESFADDPELQAISNRQWDDRIMDVMDED